MNPDPRQYLTLRHLSADYLGRWVRIDGHLGRLHALAHSITGVTSLDIRPEVSGLRLYTQEPNTEHWGSHKMIEVLYGCELCPDPIVDAEPYWLGGDDAYPAHKACADKQIADERRPAQTATEEADGA